MSRWQRFPRVLVRIALHATLTLAAVVVASFVLAELAPGDVVDTIIAEMGSASPETAASLRELLGLNDGVAERLAHYVAGLLTGNLGFSPIYNLPVAQLVFGRLPASLALAGSAMLIALVVGTALGVLMAAYRERLPAKMLGSLLVIVYSIPGFWTGLMLLVVFSVWLDWFPVGGMTTLGESLTGSARVLDFLHHLLLPAVALSLFHTAIYARLVSTAMTEVAAQDYVRTALAKGASETTILWKHMLRNALLPLTAVAGNNIAHIASGAVTVEAVFDWSGIGRLAFDAVMRRDFSVVTGVLLVSALFVVVANALVDVLQAWIDPRISS